MATAVSSLIGANLNTSDSTALFALGTVAETTDGGHFEYVEASATQITGAIVLITPTNTAFTFLTSKMSGVIGYDIAVCQGLINEGEFGWVAKKGRNLYVLVTGTHTQGEDNVGFGAASSGVLIHTPVAGLTLFGVWVTTFVSGGTQATKATLQWPRVVGRT
jgi:hypothetical protein